MLTDAPAGSVAVAVIAGPTATGKSRLAMALAATMPSVIINADSMQVYGELSILTARPPPLDMACVPHRLFGILPGAAAFSATAWRDRALAAIAEATAAGRLPILVGGTGLYLRALIDGLSPIPPVPPAVRAEAMRLLHRHGSAGLHARLAAADPAMAAKLAPGDRQRLVRAWEVLAATGRSLADWQQTPPLPPPAALRFRGVVLMPPRPALYDACNRRLEAMVRAGALAEVARLLALGLAPDRPVMKALGVRELAGHVAGDAPLAAATAAAATATRQFAKRQTTWFRHQIDPATPTGATWRVINAQYSKNLVDEIVMMMRGHG